ncbi:DUF3224 domain-containing protein [Nocardioides ochotonae]|uniref:DUF3224 domain-containing protein n=1 Tax=Nocardioides ochotonae TaxID=2685869 RepID=UPI00140A6E43|nr:DUF3224 domain-containing protein [Nocardioides ochotonae]
MHATSTFTVSDWTPTDSPTTVGSTPVPETSAPAALAQMVKTFQGDLAGHSVTWFLGCLNPGTGHGSYAAVEAIDGVLGGRRGTFNVVHAASTHGSDRFDEHLVIVPHSGAGDLTGIAGTGRIDVDADGTHRLLLDYTLDG